VEVVRESEGSGAVMTKEEMRGLATYREVS
jgi:hypothetical protein